MLGRRVQSFNRLIVNRKSRRGKVKDGFDIESGNEPDE